MTVTGRTHRGKQEARDSREAEQAGHSAESIARAARVEELRRLVAAGRYKVEPHKLALRILARALRNPE